jgi:uncharacterized membrane protein
MSANPYEAPRAAVADHVDVRDEAGFVDSPRRLPAAQGWHWIRDAWELFKSSPAVWLMTALMYVGAVYGARFVPYVGVLGVSFLYPFFFGIVILLAEGVRRGRGADTASAMAALVPHMASMTVLSLGFVAMTVISAVVAYVPLLGVDGLGVLIGIVPRPGKQFYLATGIRAAIAIPLSFLVHFTPNLVLLHAKSPLQAMRTSFAACARNILPYLYFFGAFIGLGIAASLPLLLGWFALLPVLLLVNYTSYRDIFFVAPKEVAPQATANG